ncbi:ATP-binding cassette domain-containing protein [Streptomyces sp. PRKS01-65]|nr:ABC transporter ATP-binding protein [Streptomyces harenosi]NEY36671.1 ATP-binding cassette domain-containing protein [Streptomyces harenosi]
MRCESVGKRYGRGRWVLVDVDLQVPPGAVVAVAGGNGSGKSTLLRILAGVSRPTSGRVSGRPPRVGYVPDRFTAHDRLPALAYLTHMGRVRGMPGDRARARAHHLLDRLALVGGEQAPLRTLSKGNAQKVALAQALLVVPDLLVLDEPWSGLDVAAHAVLAELLGEVAGQGGTVVFTDHREAVAAQRADHAYVVRDGRLAPQDGGRPPDGAGTVEVVLSPPAGGVRPAAPDWRALPGVTDTARRGEALVVRVGRGHSDAVLLTALRLGWSVDGVGPVPPGRDDRANGRRAAR